MEAAQNLFVIGAGFSFNAGLPLANNFTRELLNTGTPLKSNSDDNILIEALTGFVSNCFGDGSSVDPGNWPPLEDLFTTIDLAANTGHNLSKKYHASHLRTMRRALIVRFTRMLKTAYDNASRAKDPAWHTYEKFIRSVRLETSAFLSLNWDTVVESGVEITQSVRNVDYACGAKPAEIVKSVVKHRPTVPDGPQLRLLKPHGSINWMYCDNCSCTLWFPPTQTDLIAARLFKEGDKRVIYELIQRNVETLKTTAKCPDCATEALGTRFATFSFRKALDFPMHQATWREAEHQLRKAENWIFIGYSLPAADYEFKFLMKRVQLSRKRRPKVIVVTADTATASSYCNFFGEPTIPAHNMYCDGLNDNVLDRLRCLGALRTESTEN